MRVLSLIAVALATVGVLTGCNSKEAALSAADFASSVSKSSNETSSNGFLVGTWKGEVQMPELPADDPAAAIAKGMGDMLASSMQLELMDDDKFRLSALGFPIEGDFVREGNKLKLTPAKVLGMTVDEFKAMSASKGQATPDKDEFTKPLTLTISMDGKELVAEPEEGQEKNGSLVFKRDTSVVKTERLTESGDSKSEKTLVASGTDMSVVGHFGVDLRIDESKLSEKDKAELPMAKAMIEASTLDIASDKTFRMTLVVEASGNWTIEGNILTLNITHAMGMKTTSSEPMKLKILDGGRTLKALQSASAGTASNPLEDSFFFVKK
ncbi:MAG: hypothetical protein KF784_07730 [Fimbriimonadaceae bacterium]|nr:hypothetical protein [Fimbriimonadaceae bacterium]